MYSTSHYCIHFTVRTVLYTPHGLEVRLGLAIMNNCFLYFELLCSLRKEGVDQDALGEAASSLFRDRPLKSQPRKTAAENFEHCPI
jgi:hypothetical protein